VKCFPSWNHCKVILFLFLFTLTFIQPYVFPQQSKLSKGVNYISEFIASDYFKELTKTNSDLALTDTIYLRAVHFKNFDYSEALLALTFAVIPYKTVPIIVPLLGIRLNFPLVSDCDSIFVLKNKHLPKKFYDDTPTGNYGDKDKLAHFFGSAYISYTSRIFDLENLIGYFVEQFEKHFKVQSGVDPRDMMTNSLGQLFGKLLKKNKAVLPSDVFIIHNMLFIIINL
jgi:hypothetical protein